MGRLWSRPPRGQLLGGRDSAVLPPPPRGGLEHTGDWGLVQEPHGGCCFLSQLIPPIDPLMASYAGKDIVSEPDDGNVSWGVTTASSASCSPMRARHYICTTWCIIPWLQLTRFSGVVGTA